MNALDASLHIKTRHIGLRFLLIAISAVPLVAMPAVGQEDDDEPNYRPGLVGRYSVQGSECARTDDDVAFVWGSSLPDERLPQRDASAKFAARWQGRLFTIATGDYRLVAYAQGKVQLKLAGQTILEGQSDTPAWLAAKPIRLEYGYHPLELSFEKTAGEARIALYWQGPQFQLEPIPARHWFHDPGATPPALFAEGRLLTRALRCAACHEIPGQPPPLPAPSLVHTGKQVTQAWLVDWLSASEHRAPWRRMPDLGLTRPDAEAIAAYLADQAQPVGKLSIEPDPKSAEESKPKDGDKDASPRKPAKPSKTEGAMLFRTLGCFACHQVQGVGGGGLFSGGDLTAIANKRPAAFFPGWLADPKAFNPAHRMPVFRLTEFERQSLGLYLESLRGDKAAGKNAASEDGGGTGGVADAERPSLRSHAERGNEKNEKRGDKKQIERGRQLVTEHHCAACHALPGKPEKQPSGAARWTALKSRRLSGDSRWDASCLAAADAKTERPGFALAKPQADAIRHYVATQSSLANPGGSKPGKEPTSGDGPFVLAERNCLACHTRELEPGLAAKLPAVVALDESLPPLLPALTPPALNGVGDKLHDEWLLSAIESRQPLRPWLHVRMPRFNLDAAEKQALVGYFVAHDRIPPLPETATPLLSEGTAKVAGSRLVTADGFGCTSCHQVGKSIPHKVALNAHGTDLSLAGRRIRRPWFDRWVRDPARIVPRMEMPSVKLAVHGVLDDNIDRQLEAVWHVLNLPGFDPPLPNPIRTVRRSGVPEAHERAAVLTDVLEVGKQVLIRPLIVGLPNRHSVLFDLETNRLSGWWIGDVARQRTRGKSWYWESGGAMVWPLEPGESDLALRRQGKLLPARKSGQVTAQLQWFEYLPDGVRFAHTVSFDSGAATDLADNAALTLSITETWTPLGAAGEEPSTGFLRRFEAAGLPAEGRLILSVGPKKSRVADSKRKALASAEATHPFSISLRFPEAAVFSEDPAAVGSLSLTADAGKPVICELEYRTPLPVDRYIVPALKATPSPPLALDVVPGFDAVRLALPNEIMPTGLAWDADHSLVITSLKGQTWLAKDTDQDGLPDQAAPLSDGSAAPYGTAVPPDAAGAVDVINKYALLRLLDRDRDGWAERVEVLAGGWGYTADYHDWAVGLPRDRQGRYYVALPCEQDRRSEAAALMRGKLLRIEQEPAGNQAPGRWITREICGGLRFPMGLALDRRGAVFASDNQGNYNPFNELNHLLDGKRYGFINSREKTPGFNPPLEDPAINIPHPWTRSVNGICFLDTPEPLRAKAGPLFGDFEGHLIGCEYDTQRLVRMSLEPIGDTYQGAAYPLSVEPVAGRPGLEGPVVCAIAPDGDLYIGNMRDSGWGAGANTGSLVRLRPTGKLPLGIAEARATADGFALHFTGPVDPAKAGLASSYAVDAYRRVSTPAYGGADADRHSVKIVKVRVSNDARRVDLTLEKFQAGFVYELRAKDIGPAGLGLFPAEAHYTLRKIP